MEGRGLAKGKTPERNRFRTQSREDMFSALERIRQAARRDRPWDGSGGACLSGVATKPVYRGLRCSVGWLVGSR